MKKAGSDHLTAKQQAEIDSLTTLPEDKIDTRDIPEQRDWRDARRGALLRPAKQQVTLPIDADLIEWFRQHSSGGEGYQTDINRALRNTYPITSMIGPERLSLQTPG